MSFRLITACCLLLLLSSCARHRPQKGFQHDDLPNYPLLSPAGFGRVAGFEQKLTSEFKGRRVNLHVQLEIDAEAVSVVAFTAYRARAFYLRYDGERIHFENYTDREMPFPPERILSDIQMALWPAPPSLESWRVVDDQLTGTRRFFYNDIPVNTIQYLEGDVITLVNHRYGYNLTVRTLDSWGDE